jgi:hypothetical protein
MRERQPKAESRMKIRLFMSLAALVAMMGAGLLSTSPASGINRKPPQPSSTTCVHLSGRLGTTRPGPQGQSFTPIYLYNSSTKSCTLTGVPHVLYNEDVEVAVRLGLSAARTATAHRGGTVTLAANGGSANVLLWVIPPSSWPVKKCQPTRILSARVEFGRKNIGAVVRTSFQACSGFNSTSVTGVRSKSTGL